MRHLLSVADLDAAAATGLLAQACVLGLHDRAGEALGLVGDALGVDVAFDGVARATAQLALLHESREPIEATRLTGLPDLLRRAYSRALYLGRELTGAQCEPGAAVGALVALRELLVAEAGQDLDADLFWQVVEHLASSHDAALVRGGAVGLTYSAGRTDADGLARAVAGHLAGTSSAADAVGFLRGLLQTAREAAWQERELLAALDRRLSSWEDDTFVAHLPELRLAFAGMTPTETDRIARAVAGLHGAGGLGPLLLRDVDEAQVQRHLATSAAVVALLERDGLGPWVDAP